MARWCPPEEAPWTASTRRAAGVPSRGSVAPRRRHMRNRNHRPLRRWLVQPRYWSFPFLFSFSFYSRFVCSILFGFMIFVFLFSYSRFVRSVLFGFLIQVLQHAI
ncbi:hypothetical protein BDA96_06G098700 [Sorghum bicolor]|uniref:Uncharacterized protein n=2 Tax=Sorghum bicolor TaxID=4558 RepID=A0A1Z5RD11_SORBI|nr:hypothetical protein BDA96_06G098700 [Sorghum bicolor]OQU81640.1 hypothetical protein SORBI_3006G089601 [Sorghum bicolor]